MPLVYHCETAEKNEKEKILKAAKKKKGLILQRNKEKSATAAFLSITMEARRQWNGIFKIQRRKHY